MSDNHSPLTRALLVVVLMIGVLGFGGMGLCGGLWTAWGLFALFTQGGAAFLLLAMSVPYPLGGFFMAKLCIEKQNALLRNHRPKDETHE